MKTIQSLFLLCCVALIGCSNTDEARDKTSAQQWFNSGAEQAERIKNRPVTEGKAKNIILVVGDGMGVTTLTAARIFTGQKQGLLGEEFALSFETLANSALIKTYNTDQQTPDSAGTMTALIAGIKTDAGVLSVDESVIRGDCASGQGKAVSTLMDVAKQQGKKTAVVTTARVTHATPAATYAHSVERNWESNDAIPEQHSTCMDIAQQFVTNWPQHKTDVLFGGGRRHFKPISGAGKRTDGQDLTQIWQAQGGRYVETAAELDQLSKSEQVSTNQPLLGLFTTSHLDYVDERTDEQPSLQKMTAAALQQITMNDNGYVLVIEAGRIDHGHHDGKAYKALTETEELHQTVAWLMTQVDLNETLLVVTADHSHTLTLAGYPKRGHSLFKNIDTLKNENPEYPTLTYRNGPGALEALNTPAHDQEHPEHRQPALVPLHSETHGGEDVALYASGPWSHLFGGTMEQHWVYHVLKHAMQGE